jgi:23S rRNA (uracil1939-C5)-methyltransferase
METGNEFVITPTTLVYGGDALGRLPDGRAVFVPYVIPGETVKISTWAEKRGHARAALLEILQPSPQRLAPPCPHFTHCGGCHYQHLPYPAQLAAKTEILREQLQRIGGLSQVFLQPAVASPHPFNYRNHIQFHLDPQGKLGFQAARSNQVIPITQCHLPEAPLNDIWPLFDIEPVPGLERLSLRLGADEEIQLILESSQPQPVHFSVEELPISAVHLSPGGSTVLAGSETLFMDVLDQSFQVSAGSFFQVNTPLAEAMVRHLLEMLPLQPNMTLLDLYCGVGLFSLFLAPKVSRLIGVEVSPSACRDFAANLDAFDHVELYQAPVEEVLKQINFHPDLILVDPPRAGLGNAVLDGLLDQQAPWLAYISCDPSTLARDARRLSSAGYHLVRITPFDLFPQTYHIESVSLWEKIRAIS